MLRFRGVVPRLFAACALLIACHAAFAADVITRIEFVGNKVTNSRILRQEMVIRPGDPVDPARIEESRLAVQNLGLFKTVETRLLPDGRKGKILEVRVEEKRYLLPLPRASRNADGDVSYGFQLRYDNLSGLNQGLKLTYDHKKSSLTGGQSNDFSVDYAYPRVAGSDYNFTASANYVPSELLLLNNTTGQSGIYRSRMLGGSIGVSRLLNKHGPVQGWTVGGGLSFNQNRYAYVSGTPDIVSSSNDVAWNVGIDYTDIRDYLYSRSGESYGYGMTNGTHMLGSNVAYIRHEFYVREYIPVSPYPYHNVDVQARLGLANGGQTAAYALGGSDSLRGFPRNSFVGNAFFTVNVEYLQPLFARYPALRGVAFVDMGNAYPSIHSINFHRLETGAGVGLRYYIATFVRFHLRIDVGYGINTHTHKFYLGTGETF